MDGCRCGREKKLSVRLVWPGRRGQSGGSVSGMFPHELLTGPPTVPKMKCGRGMHFIQY